MGATIVYYTELVEISQVVIYGSNGHMPMEISCDDDSNSKQETCYQ